MAQVAVNLYPELADALNGIDRPKPKILQDLEDTGRILKDLKEKHERFLVEREAKERRLLYAIAEKLGIDVDKI